MKILAALAVVMACGAPTPVRQAPHAPGKPAVTAGPIGPAPTAHKERPVIEAPHSGAIVQITATPEGDVVLSLDELGGARLWPSLDGKQEPKLVELPVARDLALGRRRDGFMAVARDEVGGLYIAKLDNDGRTLAHTTMGVDPAFTGMTMTAFGLLGWRTDHHVLLIDADGAVTSELGTEPEQRIVDIAANGTKALAIIETSTRRRPRWITLQPRLAWGGWIDHGDLASVGNAIALAPDHKHFAAASKDDRSLTQVTIYDAATGQRSTTRPVPVAELDLEFIDDNTLAIANPSRSVQFLGVNDNPTVIITNATFQTIVQRQLVAAGKGRAIVGRDSELMLITPTTTEFLGYQTLTPQLAAAAADGMLLVVSTPNTMMLDANLRETARKPQLGVATGGSVADVEWLGGDDWLVESSRPNETKLQLAIVDVAKGTSTVVRDGLTEVNYLNYEPSTKLATLSFGPQAQAARVNLRARTLDQVVATPNRTPYEETAFVPIVPSLARGNELITISVRDKPTFKWFKTAGQDKPSASMTVDGAFLGADSAGRVYAWHPTKTGGLEVGIYTDGTQTGTLPTKGPASLWPDATGAFVAEAAQGGLTMYRDGRMLWTRQLDGVHEVLWLSDGSLAITHAMGIARLDPKTGTLGAARCGWEFGLSTKQHPSAPRIEPICSQLAR